MRWWRCGEVSWLAREALGVVVADGGARRRRLDVEFQEVVELGALEEWVGVPYVPEWAIPLERRSGDE